MEPVDDVAAPVLQDNRVDVNQFHEPLGHPGEAKTRMVVKAHGVKSTGKFRLVLKQKLGRRMCANCYQTTRGQRS